MSMTELPASDELAAEIEQADRELAAGATVSMDDAINAIDHVQEGGALFDRSQYDREDLAIPKVDGETIDRISIRFSGEIFLDRSDPNDVALFNGLKLGHDTTLMVEAKTSATAARGATDRDGDLDVVVGQKAVKVHTVYRPAGQAAADETSE